MHPPAHATAPGDGRDKVSPVSKPVLLSIYTFIKNGLFYDYHVVDMLKHHLPFADEIIVNEGYSTDGTFERISKIDPKIRIFRTHWPPPGTDKGWYLSFKNEARAQARGEWCLLLDADEFVPEWDFEPIREYLKATSESMIAFKLINFYGNYKVYFADPAQTNAPFYKMLLHRNTPDFEVWGDGANVRLRGQPLDWTQHPLRFTIHHFGGVRHAARLRQAWHAQGPLYTGRRRWRFRLPKWAFDLRPHNWFDPQFLGGLAVYDGPYIKTVRDNPNEFVRDRMRLYKHLTAQARSDSRA